MAGNALARPTKSKELGLFRSRMAYIATNELKYTDITTERAASQLDDHEKISKASS